MKGFFSFTCTLTVSYPFIRYLPIVIVMSISHLTAAPWYRPESKAKRFHTAFQSTALFGFRLWSDSSMSKGSGSSWSGDDRQWGQWYSRPATDASNGGGCMRTMQGDYTRGAGTLPAVWWLPFRDRGVEDKLVSIQIIWPNGCIFSICAANTAM